MKKIREYHIEHYWQAEAVRRKKRAKISETAIAVIAFVLFFAVSYGFVAQLFEVL